MQERSSDQAEKDPQPMILEYVRDYLARLCGAYPHKKWLALAVKEAE